MAEAEGPVAVVDECEGRANEEGPDVHRGPETGEMALSVLQIALGAESPGLCGLDVPVFDCPSGPVGPGENGEGGNIKETVGDPGVVVEDFPASSSVTASENPLARKASSASRSGRLFLKRKDRRSRTTLRIRFPLAFPCFLCVTVSHRSKIRFKISNC